MASLTKTARVGSFLRPGYARIQATCINSIESGKGSSTTRPLQIEHYSHVARRLGGLLALSNVVNQSRRVPPEHKIGFSRSLGSIKSLH